MATYVILSRFSPQAFDDPKHFVKLAEQVSKKIKADYPGVEWKESSATLGRFDVIDIVESPDPKGHSFCAAYRDKDSPESRRTLSL
jgi:uncharacterized protein with GYD domain